MMKAIRCGRGLGDSIYLQSVVRHLVEKGHRLIVRSDFPDVFRPLGDRVKVTPFSRAVQISAHYAPRKRYTETTQFQDCCIGAGILYPIDLRLDWTVTDPALVDALSEKKPILCVQMPRAPMGRTDGFGMELLPDCRVIQRAIDSLKGRATIVQIGSGKPLFHFTGIDIDLANKTSIAQLLDVASISDGFLGYCSFTARARRQAIAPTSSIRSSAARSRRPCRSSSRTGFGSACASVRTRRSSIRSGTGRTAS
jgi:hypothetical protein